MRRLLLSLLVLISLIASPLSAGAQGLVTAHVSTATTGSAPASRFTWGLGLGTMGGLLGFELDYSRTPEFFGDRSALGSNSVTTVMGNLMVGLPLGVITPYAAGGTGLLRTRIGGATAVDANDLGISLGGGILASLGGPVAIRADARHFRNVSGGTTGPLDFDLGGFNYWRLSAGAALRF